MSLLGLDVSPSEFTKSIVDPTSKALLFQIDSMRIAMSKLTAEKKALQKDLDRTRDLFEAESIERQKMMRSKMNLVKKLEKSRAENAELKREKKKVEKQLNKQFRKLSTTKQKRKFKKEDTEDVNDEDVDDDQKHDEDEENGNKKKKIKMNSVEEIQKRKAKEKIKKLLLSKDTEGLKSPPKQKTNVTENRNSTTNVGLKEDEHEEST
jgi:hypothetical protein